MVCGIWPVRYVDAEPCAARPDAKPVFVSFVENARSEAWSGSVSRRCLCWSPFETSLSDAMIVLRVISSFTWIWGKQHGVMHPPEQAV
jgi:hypothetical protein